MYAYIYIYMYTCIQTHTQRCARRVLVPHPASSLKPACTLKALPSTQRVQREPNSEKPQRKRHGCKTRGVAIRLIARASFFFFFALEDTANVSVNISTLYWFCKGLYFNKAYAAEKANLGLKGSG